MKLQFRTNQIAQLLIASFMLYGILASNQSKAECDSTEQLKARSGHYAKKGFWENLPKTKIWPIALKTLPREGISAINIDNKGELNISFLWWEALPMACVHFQGNELWAKRSDDASLKWEGPFIRVGLPYQDEIIYFDRIFGNNCYKSNKGEKWCFASDSIRVGTKLYKPRLALPANFGFPSTPSYGTPIQIKGEDVENLWVFVPTENGWNVFQDTFDDVVGYKETNPNKTTPWRELTISK